VFKPELTFDSTRDGFVTFGANQRLTGCNEIYRHIYELPDLVAQPGALFMEIVSCVFEKEAGVAHSEALREAQEWLAGHLEQLRLGKPSDLVHFLSDGRVIHVRNEPLAEGGWSEVHKDITDRCRAEAQILRLSPYDSSKPDRVVLDHRLRGALSRAAHGNRFALLFLELDAFKAISGTFGDPIGVADLHQALAAGEFELKYQPIISLARSEIVSSEALIRWRKPEVGLVLPGEFIALAEQTGLMVALGDWVLKRACLTATTWPDDVRVAVNVSASQLKALGFVRSIEGALAGSGLSAGRLELEVSELTLSNEDIATLDALRDLRRIGVRIALENFGAGYSSLPYLKSFPVDIIKIDPSFIKLIAAGSNSREIFRAIVTLARNLAQSTTAKGIESQEQLDLARDAGCDDAQGYHICPPLPIEGADCAWQPGQNYGDRNLPAGELLTMAARYSA
jgi:EAL domain-containing protein (putative c-di-GMP-specific phosphodiesterase class I)